MMSDRHALVLRARGHTASNSAYGCPYLSQSPHSKHCGHATSTAKTSRQPTEVQDRILAAAGLVTTRLPVSECTSAVIIARSCYPRLSTCHQLVPMPRLAWLSLIRLTVIAPAAHAAPSRESPKRDSHVQPFSPFLPPSATSARCTCLALQTPACPLNLPVHLWKSKEGH